MSSDAKPIMYGFVTGCLCVLAFIAILACAGCVSPRPDPAAFVKARSDRDAEYHVDVLGLRFNLR